MNKKENTIADLRRDYKQAKLTIEEVNENPIIQFGNWFVEASNSAVPEPNAMTLASCSSTGRPSARIVLLKEFSAKGFTFYTNYNSQKGKELLTNPFAALVFCWLELERQIRIEGKVEQTSTPVSETYFQSRPKASQIGAWASPQSEVIPDRSVLEERVNALNEKHKVVNVLPKPEHWGGFILIPDRIEFWQGRPSRLHDRMNYQLVGDHQWKIERLAP